MTQSAQSAWAYDNRRSGRQVVRIGQHAAADLYQVTRADGSVSYHLWSGDDYVYCGPHLRVAQTMMRHLDPGQDG